MAMGEYILFGYNIEINFGESRLKLIGKQFVKFDGPFYTGFFIDTAFLLNDGYTNNQELVLSKIKQDSQVEESRVKEKWFIEGLENADSDLIWDTQYTTVYGGTPLVAPSFLAIKRKYQQEAIEIEFENQLFNITDIRLYFYDFGVGTFRVSIEVELQDEYDVISYRELIERFSQQITPHLNPFIEKNTKKMRLALNEAELPIQCYLAMCDQLKSKHSRRGISLHKALWYHRIFEFSFESKVTQADVKPYLGLLYSSQRQGPQNSSLNKYAKVYPAFGFSLMVANFDKTTDINLNRLVEIAQYFYASTTLLDTILFNKFAEFSSRDIDNVKFKVIQNDLDEVKKLANQLDLFLLMIKDSIINFTPNSILMWRSLEREWYYVPLLEALREKNNELNSKYTELVEEIKERRAATLNRFVKIFTLFAIIGPLFEAYTFLHENQIDIAPFLNIDPLIILLLLVPISIVVLISGVFGIKFIRRYY